MYPRAIENYFAPTDVAEVLTLLQQHGEQAKLLAGGQSLMPLMKLRLAEPQTIIDLNQVAALDDIREENGRLHIGALARHADVATHPLILQSYPLLADAARNIGDPQIRNRGTIAGSLVHADPSADYPPAVMALDGQLVVAKADGGTRTVALDDFLAGPLMSDIGEDELVTRIEIPVPAARSGGAYAKHSQVAGDFAIISVAAHITLDPSGICQQASIVVGGVMPKPGRAGQAAGLLQGKALDAPLLTQAGEAAAEEVETEDDVRASAAYRSQLIRVTVPEVVRQASTRAGE
ncbi:MAG: xanthine dehydrogenase family protein subunit M [Desulfurellaceae bacterium]|nr:xanthine dehydrogenase family protein subunit M [Desulfurellaceae bacterium]